MDPKLAKFVSSGDTSPEYPPSRFSEARKRSNSLATVLTSVSAESEPSIDYPGAPINSPESQSVLGDPVTVDPDSLADKLKQMPAGITPPPSEQGEKHPGAERGVSTPTPAKKVVKPAAKSNEEVVEYSTWATVAEEDVAIGLKRLAMLAKDEHKKDSSKKVEQYYSEYLTKLINEAELQFDCGALH